MSGLEQGRPLRVLVPAGTSNLISFMAPAGDVAEGPSFRSARAHRLLRPPRDGAARIPCAVAANQHQRHGGCGQGERWGPQRTPQCRRSSSWEPPDSPGPDRLDETSPVPPEGARSITRMIPASGLPRGAVSEHRDSVGKSIRGSPRSNGWRRSVQPLRARWTERARRRGCRADRRRRGRRAGRRELSGRDEPGRSGRAVERTLAGQRLESVTLNERPAPLRVSTHRSMLSPLTWRKAI